LGQDLVARLADKYRLHHADVALWRATIPAGTDIELGVVASGRRIVKLLE
jgi:hypothetical protein